MKTFFDSIFMDRKELETEDIYYPIKLEYYRTIEEEKNVEAKYGIKIVKKEYIRGDVKVETSEYTNLNNNIDEIDKILAVLRDHEVTPISMHEVLEDMFANIQH